MKEVKDLLMKTYDEINDLLKIQNKTLNDRENIRKLQDKAITFNNTIYWLSKEQKKDE